jgi:hypothetical protein
LNPLATKRDEETHMADPAPYPDTGDDVEPDRGSITSTPRWVKVSGLIALVLVLLVGVMLLVGGGSHGPDRHTGDAGGQTPSAGGDTPPSGAGGHTPPPGGHAPPDRGGGTP